MSREPRFPADAEPGHTNAPDEAKPTKAEDKGENKGEHKGTKQFVTGAAVGIGSAALMAALLYANRSKKKSDPNA